MSCENCAGGWLVLESLEGDTKAVPCPKCRAPKALEYKLKEAGVPPKERHWRLANLDHPYLVAAAEKALRRLHEGQAVLFMGGNGRGKTCASVAALAQLIEEGRKALYVWLPDWLLTLRSGYQQAQRGDKGAPTEVEQLAPLLEAEYLLLDDLGAEEKATAWVCQMVRHVLHKRHVDKSGTLVTTNLPFERVWIPSTRRKVGDPEYVDGIREWYGSGIASRLSEYARLTLPDEAADLRPPTRR